MGCVPLFLQSLDFFRSLWRTTNRVKLIINNAPEIRLPIYYQKIFQLNRLSFGRQLLCYSNTKSTVVINLTVLSSTTDKINLISNHFCRRWSHEYVVSLCETQWASKLNINSQKIMLFYFMMKRCPDTFGKMP